MLGYHFTFFYFYIPKQNLLFHYILLSYLEQVKSAPVFEPIHEKKLILLS